MRARLIAAALGAGMLTVSLLPVAAPAAVGAGSVELAGAIGAASSTA